MKKRFLILLFTVSYTASVAQNLVPNPGFEQLKLCPTFANSVVNNDGIQRYTNDWENASLGSTFMTGYGGQYLHECVVESPTLSGIPQSAFTYKYAHSGKAMALIAQTYEGVYQRRLFYGTRLIAPMKIGHKYNVSFYVSRADSSFIAMNNMGIVFFTKKMGIQAASDINSTFYPDTAHVVSKEVISDASGWTKVEGIVLADSAYEYMVVGNFYDHNKTTYTTIAGTGGTKNPIYLLDDFNVEESQKVIQQMDTLICQGDSAILRAIGLESQFFWSYNKVDTISTKDFISLSIQNPTKIYLISASGMDSISLIPIPRPERKIPQDTTLCETMVIKIDGSVINGEYLWSDLSSNPIINVNHPSTYYLKTKTGSCYRIDTLIVNSCETELFIPNAFTPNGDGNNDVFLPKGVQIRDYNMTIYNKWGVKIFSTSDCQVGWTGEGYPSDVYVFSITYSSLYSSKQFRKSGTLTLLR